MSSFGGHVQFGAAQFGGDPFGLSPLFCIDRMLAALDTAKVSAGGFLRTVALLTSDPNDIEALGHQLQDGLPAVLVGYTGGPYSGGLTTAMVMEQQLRLVAVCVADNLRSRTDRLGGRSIYRPGLLNLMRWAAFKCGRALNRIKRGRRGGPTEESFIAYGAETFVGVVNFSVTAAFDLYDDDGDLTGKLERLGIVHTPSDLEQLFESDNETPNTDDPTSLPGPGVAEL